MRDAWLDVYVAEVMDMQKERNAIFRFRDELVWYFLAIAFIPYFIWLALFRKWV
jgi:hypothetical protein